MIPAHNESTRLGVTLAEYYVDFSAMHPEDFEFVVVCNGCTDSTPDVAAACARAMPGVRVVVIVEPIGKGGAVIEGIRHAVGDFVAFADADGATDASSLMTLISELAHVDVAIGSRRTPGSVITRRQPITRRVLGRAFSIATRLLFGLTYDDTQCGAKAMRRQSAHLLAECIRERRWAFDVDLLLSARRLGLSVAEKPVTWKDVNGSKLEVFSTAIEVLTSFRRLKLRERQMTSVGSAARAVASVESTSGACIGSKSLGPN